MTSDRNAAVRTVLAGLGRVGWKTHLPALLAHSGFSVTAAVDPAEDRLNECKTSFGIPGFRSLDEALQHDEFDLAVIASPTCFHAEQAVAAMKRGCHVFCDKPVALNYAQFREMASAAMKNRRVFTVYQPERLSRHNLFIKELIRSGKLGEVFLVKLLRERFTFRNDWQALLKNGGGMLLNYGSHMVDQANYLFGEAGRILSCTADRILSKGDADDVVKLLLRYGGTNVDIDINQAAADSMFRYAVFGSKGSAVLPAEGDQWRIHLLKNPAGSAILHSELSAPGRRYPSSEAEFHQETVIPPETVHPAALYYDNLHRVLTAGEKPLNPLAETETLVRMIDEAGNIAKETCA